MLKPFIHAGLAGDSRDQSSEEGRGQGPYPLHEGQLAGAIDCDVELELELAFERTELNVWTWK